MYTLTFQHSTFDDSWHLAVVEARDGDHTWLLNQIAFMLGDPRSYSDIVLSHPEKGSITF